MSEEKGSDRDYGVCRLCGYVGPLTDRGFTFRHKSRKSKISGWCPGSKKWFRPYVTYTHVPGLGVIATT